MSSNGIEGVEKLLHNVIREVFQTETSAVRHCLREAERLGAAPPAEAMRAISDHAREALRALVPVCEREHLPVSVGGSVTGMIFSALRDKLADRLIQSERSYRGTLLGVHHGVDLMELVSLAAAAAHKPALQELCDEWLPTRIALLQRATDDLAWFVTNPERAIKLARPFRLSAGRRSIAHA